MRHKLPPENEYELVCELTEALQTFRGESMEEINLRGAGIDPESLKKVRKNNPECLSLSFTYSDTHVFIDRDHIVLTDKSGTDASGTAQPV